MTRTLSHLSELQPELFTEISPELAAERGLKHGEWATITTPRSVGGGESPGDSSDEIATSQWTNSSSGGIALSLRLQGPRDGGCNERSVGHQ